ncbi:hypothetical protein [Microbacterium aurum]
MPEVQHHHPVGDPHHEVDVVLDEDDGTPGIRHRPHRPGEGVDVGGGEPAGGLIEQQQAGLAHERAGEGDALADGIGEGGRGHRRRRAGRRSEPRGAGRRSRAR